MAKGDIQRAKELFALGNNMQEVKRETGISDYTARVLSKDIKNTSSAQEPSKTKALLELLLKRNKEGVSFEELKDFPSDAVPILTKSGYTIDLRNGNVVLDRNPVATIRDEVMENVFAPNRKKYKFMVFSDPHIGGKQAQVHFLLSIFREAEARGCDAILDVGDNIDGTPAMHKGFVYELALRSCDEQVDAAAWVFSQSNLPIYGISGNHCGSWQKESGIDVGRLIAQRSGGVYKDLGPIVGWLAGPTGEPRFIRLFHPNGGVAYALSHKDQKLMEYLSVGEEDRPVGFHFTGHYHKYHHMRGPKGSHYFLTPASCRQTKFMQALSLANQAGCLFIEFTLDAKGQVDRCIIEDVRLSPDQMIKSEDYSMIKKPAKLLTNGIWEVKE